MHLILLLTLTFTRISAFLEAGGHTCAQVLADDELKCFGRNDYGQLGYGDTNNRGDEANQMGDDLLGIDLGSTFVPSQIAIGGMHSCALSTAHKVKCWGLNDFGSLGYGDDTNRGDVANEMGDNLPEVDLGGSSFVPTHIVAGALHTCALSTNKTMKCFGDNIHGQLGLGDGNYRGDTSNEMGANLPEVDLGSNWVPKQITAKGSQTCALSTTNKVKCWGMKNGGSSSIGTQPGEMGNDLTDINLADSTSFEPMHIVAGYYHKCALSTANQVKCWGINNYGQLGYGDTNTRGDTANEMGDHLPVVDLGSNFVPMQIIAGNDHNCALSIANEVKCWGLNNYGQLGHGDTNNKGDTPNEMGDNLPETDLGAFTPIEIVAGNNHNCALSMADRVKCWGSNGGGALGYGDMNNRGDGANEMGDNLLDVVLVSTPNPSLDPTEAPTRVPTEAPTRIPTSNPTRVPTTSPTSIPTSNPMRVPTTAPTRVPTSDPSHSPTPPAETDDPTLFPTDSPTSAQPSTAPTRGPTSDPSRSPTSDGPTLFPTDSPTSAQPSTAPTSWEECIDEAIQLSANYIQLFIKIDAANRRMQIQMSAPNEVWFGIGFGSDTMSNTIAITVSSIGDTMAVRTRRLRHHLQGDIVSNALDDIETTEFASNRMVTILQSWNMDGLFDFSDFFDGNQCQLPIIWAVGSNSLELSNHGSNRGSVTLRSCMCTKDPTNSPSQMPTDVPTDLPIASPTKAPVEDVANTANYVGWWIGTGTWLLCMYYTLFCF